MTGIYPAGITPLGYQQLTVSSTALALTVPAGTQRVVIGVQAQPIRWRDDSTNPTTNVGMLQKADTFFELNGPLSIKKLKVIRAESTDAVLNIAYYG